METRAIEPTTGNTSYIAEPLYAIVNPVAGSGRPARTWPAIRRRLERLGLRIHEAHTAEPGAAMHLARSFAEAGARELLVVGGDGTLNEVVNGLLDDAGRPLGPVTVTAVPCGTGRDFPRLFGITRPEQAIDLLRTGEPCRVDVGRLTFVGLDGKRQRRYFVNMADVGLGAETAAWVSNSTKQLGGFLAYLVGALRTILRHRAAELALEVDGQPVFTGRALMVAIANGRFHAGGMRIAPMASVVDGKLEVFVLREVSRPVLLGSLLPSVYRGTHVHHPAVQHWRGATVRLTAPRPIRIEMDGEPVGTTDLEAGVVPRALTIRVPAGTCLAA
ncbi:MAG: diacylglycerol kinase family lipid kinase [Thermomicrobium sp.]|nr:diacylglycerol kinase family lipid kinase [Thermomicrobium sp.]MDW8059554.1 diacylglycerol kinase family lipid kinase [Thermomicrobium sp.]